jgi:hypothetical protein
MKFKAKLSAKQTKFLLKLIGCSAERDEEEIACAVSSAASQQTLLSPNFIKCCELLFDFRCVHDT